MTRKYPLDSLKRVRAEKVDQRTVSLSDALRKAEATSSDVERKTHAKEQLDRVGERDRLRRAREPRTRRAQCSGSRARCRVGARGGSQEPRDGASGRRGAKRGQPRAFRRPRKSGRCSPPRRPRPRSSRSTTRNGGRRAPRRKSRAKKRAPKKHTSGAPRERRDEAALGLCRNRGDHRVRCGIGVHEPRVACRIAASSPAHGSRLPQGNRSVTCECSRGCGGRLRRGRCHEHARRSAVGQG